MRSVLSPGRRSAHRGDMTTLKAAVSAVLAGITATAFVLSFASVRALAVEAHIAPGLAWGVPVVIDGLELIGAASILVLAGHRSRAVRVYPWIVTGLACAASVAANAVRGSGYELSPVGAGILSAAPGVAILLGLHLLGMLVWNGPKPKRTAKANAASSVGPVTPPSTPTRKPSKPGTGGAAAQRTAAVSWVREQLAAGAELSSAQVAEHFGVSRKSGLRYLAQARSE